MNINQFIPEKVKEFQKNNSRYSEIIAQSYAGKEEKERAKRELNLAPTPKVTVYEESSLKLYRFTPQARKLHPTPLLIIPSLILRYYVMDLFKDNSLIEYLVKKGIDTYLLDWGVPGDEHGELTFDYYIDTFIRRSVRKVCRLTGAKKINLLGQCIGGTLAAVYTALHQDQIEKLVLLTAPIDFRDAGLLSLWTDRSTFDIDRVVDTFGAVIPPEFLHACFQFLDLKSTVERYKKLYKNVLDENFLYSYRALNHWSNDAIPFPGEVFRRFIRDLYQQNLLAMGGLIINGTAAELSSITCPVLAVAAEYDHVFPEKAAKAITRLTGGPVDYHCISAGHVTLITLFPQRMETYGLIEQFLA